MRYYLWVYLNFYKSIENRIILSKMNTVYFVQNKSNFLQNKCNSFAKARDKFYK